MNDFDFKHCLLDYVMKTKAMRQMKTTQLPEIFSWIEIM